MQLFKPEPLTYFHISRPAPCPYLPAREEQMVFTDLGSHGDPNRLHDRLSHAGFRRSQSIAYKPNCGACEACVPLRVAVADFTPGRSLRRIRQRNENIVGRELPPVALSEHFDLFQRYINSRHDDGGMSGMAYDDYVAMVQDTPVLTRLFEYRRADGSLLGVCLTDVVSDGLSLVYSFFDPDAADCSPGTFIILWHIAEAERPKVPYVYLGYWIEGSRKMAYKTRFRPAEVLCREGWRQVED
ncbi:MAG: arginyltransferase [Alphaproteobacteria bacterium]|nr:arginyltransferase [Alphaproteobacteria bacterium]